MLARVAASTCIQHQIGPLFFDRYRALAAVKLACLHPFCIQVRMAEGIPNPTLDGTCAGQHCNVDFLIAEPGEVVSVWG